MEMQERYKIDLALFDSTGATAEQISQYYDMKNYKRIDFFVAGKLPISTALSTIVQQYNIRLLMASNATGGGATGISSATAMMGRSVKNAVSIADKANEILIQFTTLASGATLSVLGYEYKWDSTADATNRVMDSTGATANASVAAEAFVTNFNSTANNPLATVWTAATVSGALVKIVPFAVDAQATYITATGTTLANVGMGKSVAHLACESAFLRDGMRYVAIGVKSSNLSAPVMAMAYRELQDSPVTQWGVSAAKYMAGSTSK